MSGTLIAPEWDVAHRFCHDVARAMPPEPVPLCDAAGRTLAQDVVALSDVPHYASSAMDGWAVAGARPWRLVEAASLNAGDATPIVTGGLVPAGTLGVLRSEHGVVVDGDDRQMLIPRADVGDDEPRVGDHIRPVGEEVRQSEIVVRAGALLNPAHIAVAAACGHDTLSVRHRPRVGLILTGDDVVESGIPTPGRVRDTLGPQLPALIEMLGGVATARQRIGDQLQSTVSALAGASTAEDADVLVTTGGTSGSPVDHLRTALRTVEAEILIDGVNIRPGGPCLLARLTDARLVVCLPGNPLAAMIGLLALVRPLLAGLRGAPLPACGTAVVGHEVASGRGRSRLLPYRSIGGVAVPSQWLGSAMLRGLAEADGVLVCPQAGAHPGDQVVTLPLPW